MLCLHHQHSRHNTFMFNASQTLTRSPSHSQEAQRTAPLGGKLFYTLHWDSDRTKERMLPHFQQLQSHVENISRFSGCILLLSNQTKTKNSNGSRRMCKKEPQKHARTTHWDLPVSSKTTKIDKITIRQESIFAPHGIAAKWGLGPCLLVFWLRREEWS